MERGCEGDKKQEQRSSTTSSNRKDRFKRIGIRRRGSRQRDGRVGEHMVMRRSSSTGGWWADLDVAAVGGT